MTNTRSCISCGADISYRHKNARRCVECRRKKRGNVQKICSTCGGSFFTAASPVKAGRGKYCSQECYWKSKKGKPSGRWSQVKKVCELCGKIFYIYRARHFKGEGRFCSRDCMRRGIRKPCINRKKGYHFRPIITLKCLQCNKSFEMLQSKAAILKPKFCSHKCYAESLEGKPSWNKGKNFDEMYGAERAEDVRKLLRQHTLEMYKSGKFPKQTNTRPEVLVFVVLLMRGYRLGKDFFHQYNFYDKFMCDFAFPEQKVIVECDGDYWHANPVKYDRENLQPIQKRMLGRDRAKEAYIRKVDNGSWTLLRFWESDIKKNITAVVDKIETELRKRK